MSKLLLSMFSLAQDTWPQSGLASALCQCPPLFKAQLPPSVPGHEPPGTSQRPRLPADGYLQGSSLVKQLGGILWSSLLTANFLKAACGQK